MGRPEERPTLLVTKARGPEARATRGPRNTIQGMAAPHSVPKIASMDSATTFASGYLQFRGLSELKGRDAEAQRIVAVLGRYGAEIGSGPDGETPFFSRLGTALIPEL